MKASNSSPKKWMDIQRNINEERNNMRPYVCMDNTFRKVEKKIKGLNTSLTEFQRTSVRAMIDVENGRRLNVKYETEDIIIQTTAGVFSDPVGSGKTISILALILLQKSPKAVSDIIPLEAEAEVRYRWSSSFNLSQIGHISGCIKRKYKKIIKTTIVFAGASVIEQWAESIEQFTVMSYFKVTDVRHLRVLLTKIEDGTVSKFDIIIIKNGVITAPVLIPFGITIEQKNSKLSGRAYIYNIISNVRNICWSRVIVDDFDTIHLPNNAGIVNGLFTWYISSTRKYMEIKNVPKDLSFTKIEKMLFHYDYGCARIMGNASLFSIYNIRNGSEFIKNYNNLSNPRFYVVKYKNLNDRYIGLLGEIGSNRTNEVIEMINSGSLNTAAETLNIQTTNVADMFEKILGSHFSNYKKSTKILKFIDTIPTDSSRRMPASSILEQPDDIEGFPYTYGKRDLIAEKFPDYNYPNLKGIIKETKEEYRELKQKTGATIQRIKDNIGEDDCPICSESLKDADRTIIMKCCSVITCDICGFSSLNARPGMSDIVGRCPKCRTKIGMTSLISIGFNLDHVAKFEKSGFKKDFSDSGSDSSDSDSDSDSSDSDSSSDTDSDDSDIDDEKKTKIDGLIRIIRGKKINRAIERQIELDQLQKGSSEIIEPKTKNRKVLVFASYDEAIKNIIEKLVEKKITYWKLSGMAQNINMTARAFNNYKETCVLVINSTNYCSGLNLQTATDLVFMHKIIDLSTEVQVIGRGQRLGRDCTLKVWYLLFENEERFMNTNR